MNLDEYICTGTLYTLKVFKVLEPISTMFHGRFQYYFVEPYGSKFIDGIYVNQPEYEEIEFECILHSGFGVAASGSRGDGRRVPRPRRRHGH